MTDTAASAGTSGSSRAHGRPGAPSVGTAVTIVPAGDARLLTGTLLWWEEENGPSGTTVRAAADVAPTTAHAGRIKIWATLQATDGDIVVLSADATGGDEPHTLLMSGRVAAREPRRRSVRALAHVPVELSMPGATNHRLSGKTLDLSAGGCRLSLDGTLTSIDKGEATDLVIHLDRHHSPRISGRVQAVRPGGQVVIRFDDVPGQVAEQIERYVYATLP